MTTGFLSRISQADRACINTIKNESEKAYVAAMSFQHQDITHVAVLPDQKQALSFVEALSFFMPESAESIIYFPGYSILPFKALSYHKETAALRIDALSRIVRAKNRKIFIVTCIQTLLQKIIPKIRLSESEELVMNNEEIDREILIQNLEAGGFSRTSLVEEFGEYSVRGSVLDVFSPGSDYPVRMDFFGDLVESLRTFSPISQRGIKEIPEAIIIPASEAVIQKRFMPHILARLRENGHQAGMDSKKIQELVQIFRENGRFPGIESMLSIVYESLDSFFDYIPAPVFFILDAPDVLETHARRFEADARENYQSTILENRLCVRPESIYIPFDEMIRRINRNRMLFLNSVELGRDPSGPQVSVIEHTSEDNSLLTDQLRRQGHAENILKPLADWYYEKTGQGITVISVISQDIQAKRLLSLLQPYGIAPVYCQDFSLAGSQPPGVYYTYGNLSSGFVIPDRRLALITEKDIFQASRIRRRSRTSAEIKSQFITPEELKNGDIVVHAQHGIGRYDGLITLTVDRVAQDFILVVYQDDDRLYLPVDRMEMISKYIGVDGYIPVLDKIGSKSWIKSKAKAKEEVEKLAGELLALYARRRVNQGFAFSPGDNYFRDFEASFPYTETRDQLKAIDDVLGDMESCVPMDRLVCGDVGYGKTEVAIRAAFKTVCDGKQVAIVVPTTILAEQHLKTFRERFADYPVTIECLSRFRNKKEQARIIRQMAEGRLDIVIGTHRLLQKDIYLKDLGLLVIDEEQRFGVRHKEKLKQKRSTVDVLALTATPIPRTLHLSLTGMRDISVISTPPEDRQPIVSYISKYDDTIVSEAVRKELARKGQVFFVHNNIKSISKIAQNLRELVPEARIEVAHGRLSESELEKVMIDFIDARIDVLVCTTIIESGLDIPSANTMILNKVERFGLAQIYQLRGRIGRGDCQAYAYLFISDEEQLTTDAKKRLAALMEYRDLGSGFQIAMKDLQIRGAGSALGASQSGHIAAVGYDMFLKLLDQAVKDMKGEEVEEPLEPEINVAMSCFIAQDYIESVEQRLTIYRRLSRVTEISQISDIQKELADRFGKLPKETENMLLKIMFRVYAVKAGIKRMDITPDTLTLFFSDLHRKSSVPYPDILNSGKISYEPVKKDTIRIRLGLKRSHISKALKETRNILKKLIGA